MNSKTTALGAVAILLFALWLALAALTAPGPATTPDPESQRAVTTLVNAPSREAVAAVPASFSHTLGYTPRVEDGALVNPDGDCSSPVPLPAEFGPVCRHHDYGYDLLRHADAVGGPLPADARREIDSQFTREAHEACGTRESALSRMHCGLWADIATGALRLNSWRQHDAVPAPEGLGSVATGAAGVLALGTGGGTAVLGAGALRRRLGALRLPAALPSLPRVSTAWAGVVGLALSISPSSLPHGPLLQGALTALFVGAGLGIVALLRPRAPRLTGRVRAGLVGLAATAGLATLGWAQVALTARRTEVGLAGTDVGYWVGVAAVVAALVLLARGAAWVWARRRRVWRPAVAVLASTALLASAGPVHASDTTPDEALLLESSPVGAVRAYAEITEGEGPRARAERAVAELEREGGFDRSRIVVAVPTGTGWVNPTLVLGLEGRFGSDVATVSMQYDTAPSWYAFLFERDRAEKGAQALVEAVLDRAAKEPADERPDVHVQGESLGATAAQAVLSRPGSAQMREQLCSVIWVGPPGGHRVGMERESSVINPDDPVVHASARDLVLPPGDGRVWLPVVSGIHSAADFLGSIETPEGSGHVYGSDLVDELQTCR